MKRLNRVAVLGVLLWAAVSAQAALVSVGDLSRADGSNIILDSRNGREWLGWEVTSGLSYEAALAATGAGGAFAGYSIAGNADAQLFVDALVGPNPCTAGNTAYCSTADNPDMETLVGENYMAPWHDGIFDYDVDWAWFVSDNSTGQAFGMLNLITSYGDNAGTMLTKNNEWGGSADVALVNARTPSGWLLFRTASTVPEPGTVALAGLALIGLAASGRRKPQ